MADRLRIVTFSPGGRPKTQLDLNDGTSYSLVRDTLKFDAPERQQQWSESLVRYGGAELTQESHKNAQITMEWYISGSGSADTALSRQETLMAQLESLDTTRYIEWRPDGATKSTYFPIKAPSAWEFMYRWIEFQGTKNLHLKGGWTVAPLAEGERMEIDDPFDVDSLSDYTMLTGAALTFTPGSGLALASTLRVGTHTARGYKNGDVQVIGKFRTGATVGAGDAVGVIAGAQDANNYIWVQATGSGSLGIWKRVGGVETQLLSTAIAAIAANTTYYVVLRKEGNLVTSELWTSPPLPTGTPAATGSTTLAGGDASLFGSGTLRDVGFRASAATPAGWFLQQFTVQPFTYQLSTPTKIDASGTIPGDAPALVTVDYSQPSGGATQPFALLGWTKTPGAGAPFGIFEGEAGALTTWASTANAAYRGGNAASVTTAGAGTASAVFGFDPSTLSPDDFARGEIDVEVWVRVSLAATVISPILTASMEPAAGTGFGQSRYTQEWGSSGKLLVKPSSGAPLRLMRLGVVTVNTLKSVTWNLRIAASWAAGSTGVFALDYIVLVPAQSRAASPTGKPNDATYPKFINTTAAVTRTINPDLSSVTASPGNNPYPDAGLAGAPLVFDPGSFSFIAKTSDAVPDDPTVNTAGEAAINAPARVSFSPVPRYFLPRAN